MPAQVRQPSRGFSTHFRRARFSCRTRQSFAAWFLSGGKIAASAGRVKGGQPKSSQATITLAEAVVAQTGSVFVSASCGGRGASVVAPVHIVVASVDQLVPGLDAAFTRIRESGTPEKNSMLCLITGSSRTADIEKILVMGAHGPRRLVVFLSLA